MIKYLFNNTDIFTANGIKVVKVTGLMDGAAIRVTKHEWPDKSGTDIDESTIRYKEREITIECLCTAADRQNLLTQMEAFNAAIKGVGVFSIRGDYRAAYLVFKEKEITGKYYRTVNGVAYLFTLKLTDVNPNATKLLTTVAGSINVSTAITYPAKLYWGDGANQIITNAGSYYHAYSDYNGDIDIILDADAVINGLYLDHVDRSTVQFVASGSFTMRLLFDNYMLGRNLRVSIGGVSTYYELTAVEFIKEFNLATPTLIGFDFSYYQDGTWWSFQYTFVHEIELPNAQLSSFSLFDKAPDDRGKLHLLNLQGNNLPQQDIDRAILMCARKPQYNGGTLNISGGTNAVPSAEGLVRIDELVNYLNWTVLYNELA